MLPELVAFDLDGTLWDIGHMGDESTFRSVGTNHVRDEYNNTLSLGRDIPRILNYLKDKRVPMAISSNNNDPAKARRALDLLMIDRKGTRVSASSFFGNKSYIEISSGSKTGQLTKLMRKARIRNARHVMLYDNDKRKNGHVTRDLGVFDVLLRFFTACFLMYRPVRQA
ncbi:magnesium-dependent phosphatase-1 [Crassisporium funariophilum]|nr:magnesium-dependent phosphatase-1 [Crassisporium funariophilum]